MGQEHKQVQTDQLDFLFQLFIDGLEVRICCIQLFDKTFDVFIRSSQIRKQLILFGDGQGRRDLIAQAGTNRLVQSWEWAGSYRNGLYDGGMLVLMILWFLMSLVIFLIGLRLRKLSS